MRPYVPTVQVAGFVSGLLLVLLVAAQLSSSYVGQLKSYWAHGGSMPALSWAAVVAAGFSLLGALTGFALARVSAERPTPIASCSGGCLSAVVIAGAAAFFEMANVPPHPLVLLALLFGIPLAASYLVAKVSQRGDTTHG